MVRAWHMDSVSSDIVDQREPHKLDPPQHVDLEYLDNFGVKYWKVDVNKLEDNDSLLSKVRKERGYNYHDVISIAKDSLPNYEEKLKIFFTEHIHADEEIRLVLEGSGYFDVRNKDDSWVRIELERGDMIVLPAGIYHRFTLDTKNYIKAMRLFIGEPVWTPINRPADDHPIRKTYIQDMNK